MPLKPRVVKIIKKIFETGGNHNPKHDDEVLEEIVDFLKEEDSVLALDNDINVKFVRECAHFLMAEKIYTRKTNPVEAHPYMRSFLKRMESDIKDCDLLELYLLVSAIHYTETLEKAIELARKAGNKIVEFQRVGLTENLESSLALNMCTRFLMEKYFGNNAEIDVLKEFKNWLDRLETLADLNKNSEFLEMNFHIGKIRYQLICQKNTDIYAMCEGLAKYDKRTAQIISKEADFYMTEGNFY